MAEVCGRDQIVSAQYFDDLFDPRVVLVRGDVTLTLEVLERMQFQAGNLNTPEATIHPSRQPIQPERRPACSGFQMHHLQPRMAFSDSTHDQRRAGNHIPYRKSHRALRPPQIRQIVIEHHIRRIPCRDGDPHGHVKINDGRPQGIIAGMVEPMLTSQISGGSRIWASLSINL